MTPVLRHARALGAALVCVVLSAGCGFHGLYSANLPGSVGGPLSFDKTFTITIYLHDVLDLVPQSAVKVDDVTVGTVESITLQADEASHSYKAKVVCKVKRSVVLPQNSDAILEETSLLGEKFIELTPPAVNPQGRLGDGSVIDTNASSAYPGVEEVFGVLASVLNGGGLEKLQTINVELAAALAGREAKVRDALTQLDIFVGGLNTVKGSITGAIVKLDKLATDLNSQNSTIATALDDLGPGLRVLADNRASLVALLQGLSRLGVITTKIVNASVTNTKLDLRLLEPILGQLNKAGKALPQSLELLLDYPFPRTATQGIVGDDTSLDVQINAGSVCNMASLKSLCSALGLVPIGVALPGSVGGLGLAHNVVGSSLRGILTGGAL